MNSSIIEYKRLNQFEFILLFQYSIKTKLRYLHKIMTLKKITTINYTTKRLYEISLSLLYHYLVHLVSYEFPLQKKKNRNVDFVFLFLHINSTFCYQ